jgi:hypothetical protein
MSRRELSDEVVRLTREKSIIEHILASNTKLVPQTPEEWEEHIFKLLKTASDRNYKRGWVYHQLMDMCAPQSILDWVEELAQRDTQQ